MRRMLRLFPAAIGIMIALTAAADVANAACPGFANVTVSVTPSPSVPSYDPFAASDTVRTMTVTVTNGSAQQCDAAVSFHRPLGSAATMTSGASTLQYAVERSGGGSSLVQATGYVSTSSPAPANRIDFLNIARNSSATAQIQVRIPPGQVVAAGAYGDTGVTLILVSLDNLNRPNRLIRSVAFTPAATVISKCAMPAPSLPNLNFTPAITNGRPNPGVVQTTTFSNVQCTAPSRLRLTGAALQPVMATPPRSGFDNYINFQAVGTFGAAATSLTTTPSLASVDSAQKNVTSGATTNGVISVGVNLINGNPIIAGAYTGTLTVTIDPAL